MFKNTLVVFATFFLFGVMTPALAQTPTNIPTASSVVAKIACVGTAVNAREQSIDAAMTALTGSMNAAYAARATALQQAYGNTTPNAVKAAVKVAWSAFNSSLKSARKTWETARNGPWAQYRTAAATCRAPAGTTDSTHAFLEAAGN